MESCLRPGIDLLILVSPEPAVVPDTQVVIIKCFSTNQMQHYFLPYIEWLSHSFDNLESREVCSTQRADL